MNKVKTFGLLFFAAFNLLYFGCSKETYRIVLDDGVTVSEISSLVFNEGGDRFISLDENGCIRIWDIYSGSSRLLEEGEELPDFPFEAAIGGEVRLGPAAGSGIKREFPVFSPDGTKKLFTAKDGGIILADAVTGSELARYYGFGSFDEWVSIVLEAYYNASFRGSSYLVIEGKNRRFRLEQFSDFLFRPDLFYAIMLGGGSFSQKTRMSPGLMDLLSKTNPVESPGIQNTLPEVTAISMEESRSFIVLLVSESEEDVNALEEILSLQKGGELYSTVEIIKYLGDGFSIDAIKKDLENLYQGMDSGSTVLFYFGGRGYADSNGDLRIVPWNTAGEISGDEILQLLPSFSPNIVLLLDLESALPLIKTESAVLRFRQKLGPNIMLASLSSSKQKGLFVRSIREVFDPASTGADRFLSGAEFQQRLSLSLLKYGINFIQGFAPPDNFSLADLFYKTGELKFQTMTSGMLRIDRVDTSPVPLNFGGTLSRRLPPGSYIIDMTYRNGYKETRFVNLAINDSTWVIFNYTPALLTGNYSAVIPSMGINIAELNPANYEKVNKEAMEGMGMAPYYVAYLSGEKFYREEKYDEAISEYGRAISLKADYADAYASRGNAQRKKGNPDRAIEDYTRALALNRTYAEVYNYRGFVYAQKGDYNRAILDYTEAVKNKSGYGDAYFNRAFAYGKQEKWDEAIADYTQVIRLEPSNAFAYNGRGAAWSNKGDSIKAEADYEAAAALNTKMD